MRLAIDACNIRTGGGMIHLSELLGNVAPADHGFEHVVVWSVRRVADYLPDRPWIEWQPSLEGNPAARLLWHRYRLPALARRKGCDILFSPGGRTPRGFAPVVTMSQNMLPFQHEEARRYGLSRMRLRLWLLRHLQLRSFRAAEGLIFLTDYARARILPRLRGFRGEARTIPHGIKTAFFQEPRPQQPLSAYGPERRFRLVYTSVIDVYKHQPAVAEAVMQLAREGLPLALDLIGPGLTRSALRELEATLDKLDPERQILRYRGTIANDELPALYRESDAFVFASSCENMPIIMLEAMAAGLPIASADRGPMPEMLREGGVYFDPEAPATIAAAIRTLLDDPERRARCAAQAHAQAQRFSWPRCAEETFAFLAQIARSGA